eukprot:gene10310-12640_t
MSPATRQVCFINAAHSFTHYGLLVLATAVLAMVQQDEAGFGTEYGPILALGTAMSAFWIISANSWMQTPAGFEMRNGIAYPLDWLQIIFSPSFYIRLPHMLLAAYLTSSLVVLAVGARYLLARKFQDEARVMVVMAVGMLAVVAPIQAYVGDTSGLVAAKHQPAKIA